MSLLVVFEGLRLLQEAGQILEGLKGAKVAQQHLDLLRTKLEFLGEEKAQAEEKARAMEHEIAQLQQELETHRQFRVWRGARWLRLPSGQLDLAVYCGACSKPAHKIGRIFGCSCGWHSLFPSESAELIKVLSEVSKAFGDAFDAESAVERLHHEPKEPKAQRRILGPHPYSF